MNQTPRAFFSLTRTSDAIVSGATLTLPWALKTKDGTDYADIIGAPWVSAALTAPPTVTANPAWDTRTAGTRQHTFTLDASVFADTHSVGPYTLTVSNPPRPDPQPIVDPKTQYPLDEDGGATIAVPFGGVVGELPVVLTVEDEQGRIVLSIPGKVGADGKARFSLTPGQIANLAPGTYDLYIESPGDAWNKPIPRTLIGTLIVRYMPSAKGTNALNVLPGSSFGLGFAVKLAGADPNNPTALTLSMGGSSATVNQTGNGVVNFTLALDAVATGTIPVTVSAPATATSEAIPETNVGTVTVLDVSQYLSGDLASKLGTGWIYGRVGANVPIAFQSENASLDDPSGILDVQNKDALHVGINYSASGKLVGTLSKARVNPFAIPKAAQPVPAKLALKANGVLGKSKKLATFEFSAQEMNRLEPGLYLFAVEAQKSGKFKGFGPLTLATIRVTDSTATPTEWTIPTALRVSVGQQYQLASPIPSDGTLTELTASSSDKKVAVIDATGVLTAKKAGTATITVSDASGAKLKCKLTVVGNSFSRKKPLYVKGKAALFSSTKKLYYKKGALEAEVFLYNRTGGKLTGLSACALELYDNETLVKTISLQPQTFKTALKNKSYKTLKFTLTDAQIPGVSTKSLDLGSKRFQLVIRANGVIPLTASSKGALAAKSPDALPSLVEDNSPPSIDE